MADIKDINVFQTVTSVTFEVEPNTDIININKITTAGYPGVPSLQDVTDVGADTTNPITANSFIKSGGTGANVLLDNGNTATLPSTVGLATTTYVDNKDNSKQLQLNYLDRDNSIFDEFYLRTVNDGGTFEESNQLLSSLAVLRNISYINEGYTQQINADKFVKLGGTSAQYLMADGSVTTGGGGGGGATNLAYTPSPTNGIVTSDTGTDATIPLADVTNAGLLTPSEKTKIANSVPYTGATSDVNLGEFGIQLGNLEFDNTPTNIPTTAGSVYYNDADGTLDLILKGGNVTLQVGQETVIRVVNKTATNISLLQSDYQAVRITGAQGQRPKVDLAQATNDVLSAETIGLVTETIANNQEGFITTSGLVRNINTTGSLQGETWLDGDILYLSPTVSGSITKVKPTAPNHLIIIGYVISAHITQGTIFVKVDNGYELDELHNVKISAPANNSVLAYTLSTDIWENKTVETALGYTPYNATNPSGYQTASQVQAIADAKVANTITNGVTTSAPNQDVVFDALALKANDANVVHLTGAETINGVKTFTDNLIAGRYLYDGGSIFPQFGSTFYMNGIGATHFFGGGIANLQNNLEVSNGTFNIGLQTASTIASFDANKNVVSLPLATYPSLTEISYVKGVTSAIQTQFSGKQNTLQSTVNIKSINGNSILGSGDLTILGTGISSLNGLTGATQTFSATTTTGTGIPAWTSSGTNHQLNIPIAGTGITSGLITNTSQFIGGNKVFSDTIQIPVPAGNTTNCIVLGSAGGGSATSQLTIGSTTTYPNGQEMQYVKGVTSPIQTQLNSKANGIDQPSKAYAGATPTWTGTTAPSGTTNHTYSFSRVGNLVTLRVSLDYTTAGSAVSQVTFDLPSDCPAPELPSGVSANADVINYGSGMLAGNRNVPAAPTATYSAIRIKSTGVYEVNIGRTTAAAHRYAYATIQYFTT